MVQGALACGDSASVRKEVAARRAAVELHCVAAFNEQSAKVIFRETLTQPNWPIT